MRPWITGALPLLLLPVTPAAAEISVQEALLRAKPAVALVVAEVGSEIIVSCGGGAEKRVRPAPMRETGTGWFLSPSGWMLTNAHVVSAARKPPAGAADQQARRAVREACGELSPEALAAAAARAKVRLDPSISVILSNGVRLPATVRKYSPPVAGESMSGRDLALLQLEVADMPSLTLADSTNAQLGDKIHILGFPGVVLSHELLNASAGVEASVTNGAISGFKQDLQNQPLIQTDAPAAWGNSGGPAVNSRGEVLGVLTFVSVAGGEDGGIVQGFNFVIPSAAVREFIKGTDVPLDESSRFNTAWHAGLRAYFSDDYARAETHFAEANRLVPELPDVRRMTADAKNPPPKPFPWATVAAVVTVLSLGVYAGMWGRRWQRNRYRIGPSEVLRLLETSKERPIIVDARDAATYARSPVRIPDSKHITPQELETGVTALKVEPTRTVVAYCT
jgi:S1-C subfamily serine protease